jgi:hypothetical protein
VLLVRPPQVCVFAGNLKQWILEGGRKSYNHGTYVLTPLLLIIK